MPYCGLGQNDLLLNVNTRFCRCLISWKRMSCSFRDNNFWPAQDVAEAYAGNRMGWVSGCWLLYGNSFCSLPRELFPSSHKKINYSALRVHLFFDTTGWFMLVSIIYLIPNLLFLLLFWYLNLQAHPVTAVAAPFVFTSWYQVALLSPWLLSYACSMRNRIINSSPQSSLLLWIRIN